MRNPFRPNGTFIVMYVLVFSHHEAFVEVKAFARGGIIIHCEIKKHHQYKRKYFCKGNATACLKPDTDSSFLPWEGILWNYLSFLAVNLSSDHNGTYYCAADGELHTEYQLHVGDGEDVTLRFQLPVN